jgi:hypothetical protein
MVSSLTIIGVTVLAFFVRKIFNLARYVRSARNTGLPYTITPALETEILGHVLNPILRSVYHDQLSQGNGWPKWCRFIIREWAWEDGRRAHEEFGENFLVVSPEGIICYSADATLGNHVMSQRHTFVKPRDKYSASFLMLKRPRQPNAPQSFLNHMVLTLQRPKEIFIDSTLEARHPHSMNLQESIR